MDARRHNPEELERLTRAEANWQAAHEALDVADDPPVREAYDRLLALRATLATPTAA